MVVVLATAAALLTMMRPSGSCELTYTENQRDAQDENECEENQASVNEWQHA